MITTQTPTPTTSTGRHESRLRVPLLAVGAFSIVFLLAATFAYLTT